MPRGIPNNKKKTLKRGRKSKEEALAIQYKMAVKQNENLIKENDNQAQRFGERIDGLFLILRRLEADKEGLQTVIATLGIRIGQLQNINTDRHSNYSNLQANSVYSETKEKI